MATRPVAPEFPVVAFLQSRSRTQRRFGAVFVGLLVALWLVRFASATILDKWWFDSVTAAPIWSTRLVAQIELAVIAGVLTLALLGASAYLGLRVGPAPGNGPNRIIVRYRQRMGPAHRWLIVGFVLILTAKAIPAAMGRWQPWLLFLDGPDLGVHAPEIGFDLGFHLFKLPFLTIATAWLRRLVLIAGAVALFGHIMNGAVKLPGRGRRSKRKALAHLAGLAALFALIQAFSYAFVQRPGLATNQNGAFDGPGYTEMHIISPTLIILAVVALLAAAAAVYGIWSARWRPMMVAFAVWAVVFAVGMWIVPTVVQKIIVKPAEAARELPYIAHNLDATIDAYRLDAVEQVPMPFSDGLTAPLTGDVGAAVGRMPLFDAAQLAKPLQVLEGTTATKITDVDLDRYVIGGERRPVFVSTRNASRSDLPEKGWVQTHLVYTHGDGIVAIPADSVAPDGRPDVDTYAESLVPVRSELYFGEGLSGWYAIVGTQREEQGGTRFDAGTGIALSGFWSRAVAAIGLGDIEPLTSAELTESSQLLYRRGLKERLQRLAPFAVFDSEAYPVVVDDRIVWVVDGYTKASTYPYAQFTRGSDRPRTGTLSKISYNYLHGALKATVDAYDGTVHLYQTEVGGADDPVLEAWKRILPGLVEPIADMPAELRSHLLYPPDLLTVQTALLGRYHVSEPEILFNGSDRWAITGAPGNGVDQESPGLSPAVSLFFPSAGELAGHWVAIRPYGPGSSTNKAASRDLLIAFAVADHDNPEHLVLVKIAPKPGRQVSTPLVAQSAIDTDPELARSFTLLNANGSAVQFGPMTPLPIDDGMVWARSIIVTGTADTTAPRLFGVAAVSNGIVGEEPTVSGALESTLAP